MPKQTQRAHHIDRYNESTSRIHGWMRKAIWILVAAAVLTALFAGLNSAFSEGIFGTTLRILSLVSATAAALTFLVVVILQAVMFLQDGTFSARSTPPDPDLFKSYEPFEQATQEDESQS